MSGLTAIDILIDPDETMLGRARAANARMLASFPQGFALDEHHQPHITLLQRYVRTANLDAVFDAVERLVGTVDAGDLSLTAQKFAHMEVASNPGAGLTAIVVEPGPEVLDFQGRLIEAVKPFTQSGGSADAYVRTEAEPDINEATVKYVEEYVPAHSGSNYLAHVTVGLAKLDDLAKIEAEPFEPLTFSPAGFSVYHLGNNGTAAKRLKSWSV
jgi:hypothetical protein